MVTAARELKFFSCGYKQINTQTIYKIPFTKQGVALENFARGVRSSIWDNFRSLRQNE
jgi:hypothetical protein